jgi:hypothetical protein
MELKRILARDARTANEKAMAQYGPDVLMTFHPCRCKRLNRI